MPQLLKKATIHFAHGTLQLERGFSVEVLRRNNSESDHPRTGSVTGHKPFIVTEAMHDNAKRTVSVAILGWEPLDILRGCLEPMFLQAGSSQGRHTTYPTTPTSLHAEK